MGEGRAHLFQFHSLFFGDSLRSVQKKLRGVLHFFCTPLSGALTPATRSLALRGTATAAERQNGRLPTTVSASALRGCRRVARDQPHAHPRRRSIGPTRAPALVVGRGQHSRRGAGRPSAPFRQLSTVPLQASSTRTIPIRPHVGRGPAPRVVLPTLAAITQDTASHWSGLGSSRMKIGPITARGGGAQCRGEQDGHDGFEHITPCGGVNR